MQLNPILNKEIKVGARSIKLPLMVMLYNAVLSFVAIISILTFNGSYNTGYNVDYGSLLNIFSTLAWIQCILVCFMIPVITAGAVAGERERQTLDIMLTTSVKPFSIIIGKLMSSLLTIFLLVFSSIPVLSAAFIFGGMNWINILYFTFIILILAIVVGSVGIFFSSLIKKTTVAIVVTFLTGIAITAGSLILLFIVYRIMSMNAYNPVTGVYKQVSIGPGIFLLLVNPLTSFYEFMQRSTGGAPLVAIFHDTFGIAQKTKLYEFCDSYWLAASLATQLVIAGAFLRGAANKLSPVKEKHKKVKRKK